AHAPGADAVPRRQLASKPVELAHAAGHEHEVVAVARQQPRELEPDAARGAGDDGGARAHAGAPCPLKRLNTSSAARLCRVANSCDEYTCRITPDRSMT